MIVMFVAIMRTRTTKKDNDCDMRITKERLTGYKWLRLRGLWLRIVEKDYNDCEEDKDYDYDDYEDNKDCDDYEDDKDYDDYEDDEGRIWLAELCALLSQPAAAGWNCCAQTWTETPTSLKAFVIILTKLFVLGHSPTDNLPLTNPLWHQPSLAAGWNCCAQTWTDPHLASCFCFCYHVDLGKSFVLGHSPQDNLSVTNDLSHIGNLALTTIAAQRPFLLLFVYTLTLTSFVCHALLKVCGIDWWYTCAKIISIEVNPNM